MRELLLLCNRPARGANADTIIEHIDAIKAMPGFRVREISMLGDIPSHVDLDRFDVVAIHYSLHINDPTNHFLSLKSMERIGKYGGVKCIWMHDEYRCVNETVAKLRQLGIDLIFTIVPEDVSPVIYPASALPDTRVETILAGYVSEALEAIEAPPFEARDLDVVYRARRPPFWLGSFAFEKIQIGERFKKMAEGTSLVTDISVEEWDRIYAADWLKFLARSKAALSVESGVSVVDFTGEIEASVNAYVAAHENAEFADVAHIVSPYDEKVSIKCISPRIFEMAACRSLIIAYPGRYSDVIEPWVHYVPLARDFSNFDDISDMIRNRPEDCSRIIERAHADLIASHRYRYEHFSRFCAERIPQGRAASTHYTDWRFRIDTHRSLEYLIHNYFAYAFQKYILSTVIRKYLIAVWSALPDGVQKVIRPLMRILGR